MSNPTGKSRQRFTLFKFKWMFFVFFIFNVISQIKNQNDPDMTLPYFEG